MSIDDFNTELTKKRFRFKLKIWTESHWMTTTNYWNWMYLIGIKSNFAP